MHISKIRINLYTYKYRGSLRGILFPIAILLIGIMITIRFLMIIIIKICNKIQKSLLKLFVNEIQI